MWELNAESDYHWSWFAVGFGEQNASARLFFKMKDSLVLNGFNRTPVLKKNTATKLVSYETDLKIKVTVSMQYSSRCEFSVRIDDYEQPR